MEDAHRQLNALTSARTLVFETPPRSASSAAAVAVPPPVVRRRTTEESWLDRQVASLVADGMVAPSLLRRRPREPRLDEAEPEAKRPATEVAVAAARSSTTGSGFTPDMALGIARHVPPPLLGDSVIRRSSQGQILLALATIHRRYNGWVSDLGSAACLDTYHWLTSGGYAPVVSSMFQSFLAQVATPLSQPVQAWYNQTHQGTIRQLQQEDQAELIRSTVRCLATAKASYEAAVASTPNPVTEEAKQPTAAETASTPVTATEAKQPVAVLTRDECVRIGRCILCPGEFNEDEQDLSIVALLYLYWRIDDVWSVSTDAVYRIYGVIDVQLVGFRMDPSPSIKAFFVEVGMAAPASRREWYRTGWWRKLRDIGNRHFGSRGASWYQRVRQCLEQAKQQSDGLQARAETVAVPAGSAPVTAEAPTSSVTESDPPQLRRALAVARRLVWPAGATETLDQVLWYLAVCICDQSNNLREPLSDSIARRAQTDLLHEPHANTKRFLALLRPDWSESEWESLRRRLRTVWYEDQVHTAAWCREKALELVRTAQSPVTQDEVKHAPAAEEEEEVKAVVVPMESSDDDDEEQKGPPTREETPAEAELRRKAVAIARCLPRSAGVVDDVVWFAAARACIHQALHPTEDGVRFALDWLVEEQLCPRADIDQVKRYWSDVLSIPLDQVATQVQEARNSYGTYYNEDHVHDNTWYSEQVRAKLVRALELTASQSTSSATVAVPPTESKTELLPGVALALDKARLLALDKERLLFALPIGAESVRWFLSVLALMAYYGRNQARALMTSVFEAEDELLAGLKRDTMQLLTQILPGWSQPDWVMLRDRVKEFRTRDYDVYCTGRRDAFERIACLVS